MDEAMLREGQSAPAKTSESLFAQIKVLLKAGLCRDFPNRGAATLGR
jgi:hypothetical protein